MAMSKKNMRVVGLDGPPCRRCGCPTEVREHKEVTAKELARPFYYARWFNCLNRRCRTTLIMPEEFKVINDSRVADRLDDVVTAPARHHDVALEVLDAMQSTSGMNAGDRPPWE
jgi:hypothetical protein